ncbi:MAG TPA: hypothetical protein VFL79_10555 [Terriglobia bacterium]|nr:hypothetical protein [Terriglobia bacterium]
MRSVSGGLLTAGLLTVAGYFLQTFVPDTSVIAINWDTHQYDIPYDVAAFWGCVALGIVAGAVLLVWGLLRDVERFR